jgi:hypothetical protein
MGPRSVYFSFNYNEDIWRACNVRNSGAFDSKARAGWSDSSLWEEAKRKGHQEIQRLIDGQLKGTSVTVVLIGADSADRKWIDYEVSQSISRGNGLLGVRVHRIKDQDGKRSRPGPVPIGLKGHRVHQEWQPRALGRRVERAAIDAGKPCLAHKTKHCVACKYLWWVWVTI